MQTSRYPAVRNIGYVFVVATVALALSGCQVISTLEFEPQSVSYSLGDIEMHQASQKPEYDNMARSRHQDQAGKSSLVKASYNSTTVERSAKPNESIVEFDSIRGSYANRPNQNAAIANARKLERDGRMMDAIAEYESLLERNVNSALVFHRLAVLYDQTNQFHRSLPLYTRALSLDPSNSELLCDFGYRWQIIENLQQAELYYRKSLEVDPGNKRSHNHLAVLLAQTNRPKLAMLHFSNAGLDRNQVANNLQIAQAQ